MSGKRQATSNLNHDNWDQEDEEEQRGTFRTANSDELKNRVIKKARRKVVGSDGADGGAPKSLFSGFAGFGKIAATPASTAAASPFSFLAKIPVVAASATTNFSFGSVASAASYTKPKETEATDVIDKTPKTAATKELSSSTGGTEKSPNYYAQLKSLNHAVSDWIKTHVDKNPLCLLTPIFKDYETHLSDIDREEQKTNLKGGDTDATDDGKKLTSVAAAASTATSSFKFSSSGVSPLTAEPSNVSTAAAKSFSFSSGSALSSTAPAAANTKSIFGSSTGADAAAEPTKTNGFSFGLKMDDKKSSSGTVAASSGFSFGKTDDKPATTAGFSFAASAAPAFSFGNIQPPAAATAASTSQSGANNEDEEDQPPKVEFKQVVEEDSIYSKKCKVFVKKDGNFADRGVGTLYLKPVKDSEKTQLLVRADTNLGNILVNLILSAGLPAQRMGKNNVMLVCLPMPNVEKPTSMLLRVKSGEEADELLDTIEKHKK